MTRRGFALGRQIAAFAALAVLALSLSGDRTSAAGVPATVYGQDPLEVLELKVRPNVIVVLDSSGSMQWLMNENDYAQSGDHPRSKLYQAKQVLKQAVQANQDKVSFQMGTYTQYGVTFPDGAAGRNRFQYTVSSADAPFMTNSTTELTAHRANGDDSTSNRGLQSWQIIYPKWRKLSFEEDAATDAICTADLGAVATLPKFYASGSALATDLAAAMNGATCTGSSRANTYSVSYSTASGAFTFSRSGSRNFRLTWNNGSDSIANAIGGRALLSGTSLERQSGSTRVDHTALSYGLRVGDTCEVTNNTTFNGFWTITSISSTTRFYLSGPTGSTTSSTSPQVWCRAPTAWTTSVASRPSWSLLYRTTGTGTSDTLASPFRDGMDTRWSFAETINGTSFTFYQVASSRLWNGEVIRVKSTGEVCGMDFATAATKTTPPSVTLVSADASCNPGTNRAVFTYAGSKEGSNSRSCVGFRSKSQLIPCDLQSPPEPMQFTKIEPYLDLYVPFDASGDPRDWDGDGYVDYAEKEDGSWEGGHMTATGWASGVNLAPSAAASGSTPIANSLIDINGTANASDTTCVTTAEAIYPTLDLISVAGTTGACVERGFRKLWNTGLSTGPWATIPAAQRAIKNHRDPKEKTIVLFVTDGNDTCGTRTGTTGYTSFTGADNQERMSRRAAYWAEELYRRIDPLEPASSVQTYIIGYGGAFPASDPYLLNLIAWGGSGLGQGLAGQPDVNWLTDSEATLRTKRAQCTTCTDAFIAPDAATLAAQLQAIIDQGASDGDFNAQQSITESVFEYVDVVATKDARSPSSRYQAIVPIRFVSSFSLPGFKGQLRAYLNDGSGNSVEMWSAGAKLRQLVTFGNSNRTTCAVASEGMCQCDSATVGGAIDECVLTQLVGGTHAIKRRVFTTTRNGVYAHDPATLMAGTSTERVALWPPPASVAPTDYTSPGLLDEAMGLPPNTPTAYPTYVPAGFCDSKTYDQCWFDAFQRDFKACLGGNLPTGCTSADANVKMRAARREARDITLAFMAGAATVPDSSGAGIKRTSATFQGAPARSLLYKAREWPLADSEMATAAVVTPPSLSEPEATPYVSEYKLYRDGTRDANGKNVDPGGDQIRQGFGLTQPDDDRTVASGTADTRTSVKPVMTVIYAPANDMLHAFRAGPNCSPAFSSYSPLTANPACSERGGEELWGFVPYDQLEAVRLRAANEPQGRDNHVFMLARGIRFADVFVPGPMTNVSIGNVTVPSMQGVWRRVLFFGRGIGGKHVTALDVTAPGQYTANAYNTTPPVPLWNRGNPDTQDGRVGGTWNNSSADGDAYARMGETWSLPTVAYVNPDKTNALYVTPRRSDGIDFALFMGSGYGDPSAAVREGTTHYALDALSGDVVAAVDVEDVAASYGLTRSGLGYPNAIVANSVSFNRSAFTSVSAKSFNVNPHPWSFVSARVYVGDLHGRLWKFLSAYPNVALPAADLGEDQPAATAVALQGEDVDPNVPDPATMIPNIFLTTGADSRAEGPFKNYSLIDTGVDTDPTTTGTEVGTGAALGVTTFLPVRPQFVREFDQGDPEANCGYPTEAMFRGTIQPTSVVECTVPLTGSKCNGDLLQRVFYGGTRLSLPNTKYAPPTPLSCGTGEYPCRSQFDSILYALGVKSGLPAYQLGGSDDAYRIFRDSRIAAISFQADPDPSRGGSSLAADEGLMKGTPSPPPIPGIPPTATTATANVIFKREPGKPAPAVQYGSTVCQ